MIENVITVSGNVTRTPELTFLDGGLAVLKFSIAVNKRWKDRKTDEWVERVSYFNCVARGPMADNASGSIDKGNRVVVLGRLEQRSWEAEDGSTRSAVEINVDEVAPSLRFATAALTKIPRQEIGALVSDRERVQTARFPGDHRPSPRAVDQDDDYAF